MIVNEIGEAAQRVWDVLEESDAPMYGPELARAAGIRTDGLLNILKALTYRAALWESDSGEVGILGKHEPSGKPRPGIYGRGPGRVPSRAEVRERA